MTSSIPDSIWRWLVLGTLLLAAMAAVVGGGGDLPLDGHELFVARGSEEMVHRQSYLVPYLNDEPRLKKPPLNNWLILGVHGLGDDRVSPLEARLPSMLGGVLLVGLTLALGSVLMDRPRALLAAVLVASSGGYMTYTHSARPEMLYAALSTAGLLCFMLAARHTHGPVAGLRWPALAWLAWALATLSKGPQFPAIMLVVLIAWFWRQRGWREAARVLRPEVGLPIYVLLCGGWAAAAFYSVPNALDVWTREAAMRFEGGDASAWQRLNPYYLYRTAALILPWVALYPTALLWPWLTQRRDLTRILWWLLIVSMAVMSLLSRPRWYYLLPMLAPLALLISDAVLTLAPEARRRSWLSVAIVGHGLALVVLTLYPWNDMPLTMPVRVAAAVAALLVAIGSARLALRSQGPAWPALAALGAVAVVCLSAVAADQGWWRTKRAMRWQFARQVAQQVPPDQPLLGWKGDDWIEEAYAANRVVRPIDELSDLAAALDQSPVVWVLAEIRERARQAPLPFQGPVLLSVNLEEEHQKLVLLRLTAIERPVTAALR